jgi:hypothetical protein
VVLFVLLPLLFLGIGSPAICVLYPLLSVYPQEVIYRAFFFEHSARILPGLRVQWLLALKVAPFGCYENGSPPQGEEG